MQERLATFDVPDIVVVFSNHLLRLSPTTRSTNYGQNSAIVLPEELRCVARSESRILHLIQALSCRSKDLQWFTFSDQLCGHSES